MLKTNRNLLGSGSIGGEGIGGGGGRGGDEPTDSYIEPLDLEEEEEDEEEYNMVDQNLEWITQGPLALLGVLHKISRHKEKLLTKYDLDKEVKAEDHLYMFYLHL